MLDRSRDNNTVFVCRVCWFVYSLVYFGCRTRNPRSIGQTKPVKVLRLICAKTYEQQLFRTANRKLGLGQAVLQEGAAAPLAGGAAAGGTLSSAEIESLLRHGASELFKVTF